jgi:ABC-2 type transport system ATP-binding protein
MPEADALVPGLTGVEYVALAGELYGMRRRDATRRAHEVLSYLELEEARYRRVEEYSTGMKQRAKLAQALVHDPPVLLLDEPTSGLDPAGRDAMLRLVKTLGTEHGKSVILSTHLLADVEAVCERVVILASGRVRREGTVADLCARRQDRFRLRIQGESTEGFRAQLVRDGVLLLGDPGPGEWRIAVPPGWSNLLAFRQALSCGVVIRSLVRDDETLEELFLRAVAD